MEWIWTAWCPYSMSDIQDYIEYIIKKHETLSINPPIHIVSIALTTD